MNASRRSLWALVLLVVAASAGSHWWARLQQQGVGVQMAALAGPADIQMLSSDSCALCAAARAWLSEQQVPYRECSIERDTACQQLFAASGSPGTPVLLVRGQAQIGFSPQRVLQRLQQASQQPAQQLLQQPG